METLDETTSLIAAGKVSGTAVYNTAGDELGEIYDVGAPILLLWYWYTFFRDFRKPTSVAGISTTTRPRGWSRWLRR